MNKPFIVLTDPLDPTAEQGLEGCETIVLEDMCERTYRPLLRRANVFIVRSGAALPRDILDDVPQLLGVIRHGSGVDVIPMDVANRQGIPVANTPGGNAQSVAEYGVLAMGALSRGLHVADASMRADGWHAARDRVGETHELAGRTLGIVGLGEIGRRIARICHAGFGMKVLGVKRRPAGLPDFVTPATLEDVFSLSDFLVLACPLTAETRNMVSARQLASMKSSAFIVNLARGELIDTEALLNALQDGMIAGAALDVYTQEPLPDDDPLLKGGRLLLSPHIAARTREAAMRNSEATVRQLKQLLSGEKPEFLVNDAAWPQSAERRAKILETLALA